MRVALLFLTGLLGILLFGSTARAQPRVIINEIEYAPIKPEPEWVELSNPGPNAIDLNGWKITDLKTTASVPAIIPANGFLVITRDSATLRSLRPGFYPILQIALPSLNNSGDDVVLYDASGATQDSVHYFSSWGGAGGRSLERRSGTRPSNEASNWTTCKAPSGATPGASNSVALLPYDLALDSVEYSFTLDSLFVSCRVTNVGQYTVGTATVEVFSGQDLRRITLGALNPDSISRLGFSLPSDLRAARYKIVLNASADLNHANDTSFFDVPAGLRRNEVAINEILFAPIRPEPEWIELMNTTSDTIDIGGLFLHVSHFAPLAIPFGHSRIAPDSFVVLTSNDSALARRRGVGLDRLIQLPMPDLSNTASEIWITDERDVTIDSAYYEGSWVHGFGSSLERIDRDVSGWLQPNWAECRDTSGSTILRPNSVRRRDHDLGLRLSPDPDSALPPRLAIVNTGREVSNATHLSIDIPGLVMLDTLVAVPIAPLDSFLVSLPRLPAHYGRFQAVCTIKDTEDEWQENDTVHFSLVSDVPFDSVAINEIMFQPRVGSCEWIELFNRSDAVVSLSGASLLSGHTSSMSGMTIGSLTLQNKSYGVVAANASFYTFYPDLLGRAQIATVEKSSLSLPNDSGQIVLTNADETVIDSARYNARWQSPIYASTQGVSLERVSWSRSGTDSTNWMSCTDTAGATPLAPNSARFSNGVIVGGPFSVAARPNPFSPDGDGFEDQTLISIAVPTADAYAMRLRLFDARGRIVRTLADGLPCVAAAQILFDGRADNGTMLQPGLYTLFVELNSATAGSFEKKIGLAIAGKRR